MTGLLRQVKSRFELVRDYAFAKAEHPKESISFKMVVEHKVKPYFCNPKT
ncbi:MAG: hypothetical protein WBA16_09970 [Nonlabens sp.]